MKQKILFAITLLFLSSALFAQKNVDIDNLRFRYSSRHLPQKPLNPVFFHYSTKIDMPGTVKNSVSEETLYQLLQIEGQKYIETPAESDVLVNLTMGAINIISSEVKTRAEEIKDKDGKVTSTRYYYWIEAAYTFDAKAVVKQGDNVLIQQTIYDSSRKMTYTSQVYSAQKDATDFWNNNRDVMREQFTKKCAEDAVKWLSSSLSRTYGFPIISENEHVKTIDTKKHPENDAFRAKAAELKSKVESLDGTTPLTEKEVEGLIAYFKDIPNRYTDMKSNADIRLRYAAYFNLCRIYMFIDQPEKVKELADLIVTNGYDKKDGEKLAKDASDQIEKFSKSIIKASQFETDRYF